MTERELYEIRERVKAMRPHIVGECELDWEDGENGPRVYLVNDEERSVCDLLLDGSHKRLAVGQFIACAFQDVPALLAEVDYATRCIHDLQQESDAYRRGVESQINRTLEILRSIRSREAYRDASSDTKDLLRLGRMQAMNEAIESVLQASGMENGDWREALPPDRLRMENERLKRALREIIDIRDGAGDPQDKRSSLEVAKRALGE